MGDQGERRGGQWYDQFQNASFPAYVSLKQPASLAGWQQMSTPCRVKEVLMDDILGSAGSSPKHKFKIAEGSFVLKAGADASDADTHDVPLPWLRRVDSIWFVPDDGQGDAADDSSSSCTDAKMQVEVQAWEQRQTAQGRVPAQHFQLQVTYFYRLPDLVDDLEDSNSNMSSLERALKSLAIADSPGEALEERRPRTT